MPTETADPSYPAVISLLTKMGVEVAARLEPEKAKAVLKKRLTKKGVPDGLNVDEQNLVEGMGFNARPTTDEAPTETPAEEAKETGTDPNAEPPQPDEDKPVPFRLRGGKGQEDRVEMITPKVAAFRNARRAKATGDDGRRWEIDLDSKVTDPPDQQEPEITKPKPKAKADAPAETKEPPVATTKTKKGGKAKAKAAEPKATTKAKAEATPRATAKPKAEKGTNGSGRGAAATFREMLEGGAKVKKQDVLDAVIKAGAKPSSAGSYVVWAKRSTETTNPGKGGNPFGFRITETKEEDGTKFLQRIGKKAK